MATAIATIIEQQIESHGLKVNIKKRQEEGFLPGHTKQRVHNIDVKSSRGVAIVPEHAKLALETAVSYVRESAP